MSSAPTGNAPAQAGSESAFAQTVRLRVKAENSVTGEQGEKGKAAADAAHDVPWGCSRWVVRRQKTVRHAQHGCGRRVCTTELLVQSPAHQMGLPESP